VQIDARHAATPSNPLKDLLRRAIAFLAALGSLPSDSPEERVRKASLPLVTSLIIVLATVWVVTYAVLGLWWAAAIPFTFQVLSLIGLVLFFRSKNYRVFRTIELLMMLILPFALQWSLGGFRDSSAVSMWAFFAPMGALVFVGPRDAWRWFAGWGLLLVVSAVLEVPLTGRPSIPQGLVVFFFFANIMGLSVVTFLLLRYFVRERERAMAALDQEHRLLQTERAKSERLLLNVLPEAIATRLKEREEIIADAFPEVSVLFADIVGFTPYAHRTDPDRTVKLLNDLFSDFDALAEAHGVEKIKTIGDAYMAAGGLPDPRPDHAEAAADLALAMIELTGSRSFVDGQPVQLRVGIDSGPVVAGVIGRRKFIYDLWGDTVNTASRMESQGVPGAIQVTKRVRDLLADRFEFKERGRIDVKGQGVMDTYFLVGRRERE
jgi:adenylate cyclase